MSFDHSVLDTWGQCSEEPCSTLLSVPKQRLACESAGGRVVAAAARVLCDPVWVAEEIEGQWFNKEIKAHVLFPH